MASGYEDKRFESSVAEYLHCVICFNVLKQPVQCTRNEHFFCHVCITRHLQNFQRCPTCGDALTRDSLRPARFVKELISQLIIRCDNILRGCNEMVKVERLEAHVENCIFTPVLCFNEGCEVLVKREDRLHHETNECNFRQGKCEVCGKNVPHAKQKLHCYVTRAEMDELKVEMDELKVEMYNLKEMFAKSMDTSRELKRKLSEQQTTMDKLMNSETTVNTMRQQSNTPTSFVTAGVDEYIKERIRKDIVVAGGFGLKSVETFNWTTRQWTRLVPMTSVRWYSSSFVYGGKLFAVGGVTSQSIEVLHLTAQGGWRWEKLPEQLPKKLYGHTCVVYEDNLFIFGGMSGDVVFNGIYKNMCLVPRPFKLVCHMPEPRAHHGAQVFGDKVVIVGGTRTCGEYSDYLDEVLEYNITNNTCQSLPSLPYPVREMATVAWKGNIVVIGGRGESGNALDSVVVYNIASGNSSFLPAMKHKRLGCCAVETGNVIVVIGGCGENGDYLCSMEYFDLFGQYEWKELSSMSDKRYCATAVVND